MAIVFNRNQVGLVQTSQAVAIPDNPTARLMYYLDCICDLLQIDDVQGLQRLRDFTNHVCLTSRERSILRDVCKTINPSVLDNKVIFYNDALCGTSNNKFFDLSVARQTLAATDTIVVAGQQRAVSKIMTYKISWLENNFFAPMRFFAFEEARFEDDSSVGRGSSCKCFSKKCVKKSCIIGLAILFFPIACPLAILCCLCGDSS